ncbi:FAD/NAD(P)-binding domain-containing protein [Ganoderma leucocontextum]|nr:FAD/NAD(P)-binding domain-containing protein [Ganoderma leucocontextum]
MVEKGSKKNVVIVGGGAAGGAVVLQLSKKLDPSQYEIILIDARPFYTHLPAMARIAVTAEESLEDKALFGFEKLFHNANGQVKHGKVVSIVEAAPGKGGEVVLEDGERISYSALLLATGAVWPESIQLPETDSATKSHLSSWRSKFEKANHVVIVGGGAVGIELAGEIKQTFPKKSVTIVHRDSQLLNAAYPDKWRKDIERRVRARNINLLLGDSVENPAVENVNGITTTNGKSLPDADLVVQAFGSKPATSFITSLGEDVVTAQGTVRVNEFLEVAFHPGVFAAGDIIDWEEQKQAAKAGSHAGVVAANITAFLQGQALKKAYKGSPEMILIPLGKSGGSGYFGFLWGIVVGDWLTKTIKGKDLMIGMARGARGL